MAKNKAFPTPATPRKQEEINAEISSHLVKLGQNSYLINMLNAETATIHKRLSQLDLEAKTRDELDKKIAAEAKPEVTNEAV